MNLTIERDALHAALGHVAKIVEAKSTIPILSNVLLRAEDGALWLTTTNLDQTAKTSVPAEVAVTGAMTIDAKRLAGIVANLRPGSQVSLAAEKDKPVELRSGRARYQLQTLPPEDFPNVEQPEKGHRFALEAAAIERMFGKADFAISTEETRYYLNGVYLHTVEAGKEKLLRAVATDGHKLACLDMPAPAGAETLSGRIVSRLAIKEILRLAKGAIAPIDIESDQRKFKCTITSKTGKVEFWSKLIDGTFPDYQRVIPTTNEKRATLQREAFIGAVRRMAEISNERGRAQKLAFSEGSLVISSQNPDQGSAEEEIDAAYDAPPLEVGFNAAYLLAILEKFDTEHVLMKLADPGSPALLMEQDGAPFLVVLMPMRS